MVEYELEMLLELKAYRKYEKELPRNILTFLPSKQDSDQEGCLGSGSKDVGSAPDAFDT